MSRADLFTAAARARPPSREATQRARTPLADGLDHVCRVCGAPAGFGFGVFLRRGLEGRWSCIAHRDQVEVLPE